MLLLLSLVLAANAVELQPTYVEMSKEQYNAYCDNVRARNEQAQQLNARHEALERDAPGASASELDRLRHENEMLKLQMEGGIWHAQCQTQDDGLLHYEIAKLRQQNAQHLQNIELLASRVIDLTGETSLLPDGVAVPAVPLNANGAGSPQIEMQKVQNVRAYAERRGTCPGCSQDVTTLDLNRVKDASGNYWHCACFAELEYRMFQGEARAWTYMLPPMIVGNDQPRHADDIYTGVMVDPRDSSFEQAMARVPEGFRLARSGIENMEGVPCGVYERIPGHPRWHPKWNPQEGQQ